MNEIKKEIHISPWSRLSTELNLCRIGISSTKICSLYMCFWFLYPSVLQLHLSIVANCTIVVWLRADSFAVPPVNPVSITRESPNTFSFPAMMLGWGCKWIFVWRQRNGLSAFCRLKQNTAIRWAQDLRFDFVLIYSRLLVWISLAYLASHVHTLNSVRKVKRPQFFWRFNR